MSTRSPHRRSPLAEASIDLDTPVTTVEKLLLSVAPGPVTATNGWLVGHRFGFEGLSLGGGPARFVVAGAGSSLTVDVDARRATIALQGGWWYRGEYQIEASQGGTRIAHRVFNVAGRGSRAIVPLANRGFVHLKADTAAHVQTLGRAISDAAR